MDAPLRELLNVGATWHRATGNDAFGNNTYAVVQPVAVHVSNDADSRGGAGSIARGQETGQVVGNTVLIIDKTSPLVVVNDKIVVDGQTYFVESVGIARDIDGSIYHQRITASTRSEA